MARLDNLVQEHFREKSRYYRTFNEKRNDTLCIIPIVT